MINNNFEYKKEASFKAQELNAFPELSKLNEFRKAISNSDLKNSYTRYSIELKLVQNAQQELGLKGDNGELLAQLIQQEANIIQALDEMGFSIKK